MASSRCGSTCGTSRRRRPRSPGRTRWRWSAARSIGGIVRDEDGRPIEGVTVTLYEERPGGPRPRGPRLRRDHRPDRCPGPMAPRSHPGRARPRPPAIHASPPRIRELDRRRATSSRAQTPEQLRSRSGVIVLRKGLPSPAASWTVTAARSPGPRSGWAITSGRLRRSRTSRRIPRASSASATHRRGTPS